jgi:hypothetical protein
LPPKKSQLKILWKLNGYFFSLFGETSYLFIHYSTFVQVTLRRKVYAIAYTMAELPPSLVVGEALYAKPPETTVAIAAHQNVLDSAGIPLYTTYTINTHVRSFHIPSLKWLHVPFIQR